MDVNALRIWGIAVTGALMAGALAIAFQPQTRAQAQPRAVAQLAQMEARAAHVGFIVRFRGAGPIARAQGQAARGQIAQAQRQVEAQLGRQRAFAGLSRDFALTASRWVAPKSC